MSANPYVSATEFVLQPTVDALGRAALVVANVLGGWHMDQSTPSRLRLDFLFERGMASGIRVDERYVPQRAAALLDLRCIVGRIHQVIEADHPLRGEYRKGDSCLTVMHRCRAEQAADRDIAVGGVHMELIANPALLVSLAIALRADIACGRQIGAHLFQRHRLLTLQPGGRCLRGLFALFRATSLLRLVWLRLWLLDGLFPSLDGGAVSGEMANQLVLERARDQRLVHPLRQADGRKFGKGAREHGLARHVALLFPSADPPQGGIGR